MAGAILLVALGTFVLVQVFAGGALERLGVAGDPTVPGHAVGK